MKILSRLQITAEDSLLKSEDYQVYKNDYGFYNVRRKDGKNKDKIPPIVSPQPFRDYGRASAFLHKKIYEYNTKNIMKIRTNMINKLHKLFKAAGMDKSEDRKTSVRGFRPISKHGYDIYIYPGDRTTFYIGFTADNIEKEYAPKVKKILDKEGIKYSKDSGDIQVDLENQ